MEDGEDVIGGVRSTSPTARARARSVREARFSTPQPACTGTGKEGEGDANNWRARVELDR